MPLKGEAIRKEDTKMRDTDKLEVVGDISPPESPFHGFVNSEIPQPIIIKTEAGDGDDEDVIIVEVRKGDKPSDIFIKKEIEEEELFHGFSIEDIPKPFVIKMEPSDDVIVERAPAVAVAETEVSPGPSSPTKCPPPSGKTPSSPPKSTLNSPPATRTTRASNKDSSIVSSTNSSSPTRPHLRRTTSKTSPSKSPARGSVSSADSMSILESPGKQSELQKEKEVATGDGPTAKNKVGKESQMSTVEPAVVVGTETEIAQESVEGGSVAVFIEGQKEPLQVFTFDPNAGQSLQLKPTGASVTAGSVGSSTEVEAEKEDEDTDGGCLTIAEEEVGTDSAGAGETSETDPPTITDSQQGATIIATGPSSEDSFSFEVGQEDQQQQQDNSGATGRTPLKASVVLAENSGTTSNIVISNITSRKTSAVVDSGHPSSAKKKKENHKPFDNKILIVMDHSENEVSLVKKRFRPVPKPGAGSTLITPTLVPSKVGAQILTNTKKDQSPQQTSPQTRIINKYNSPSSQITIFETTDLMEGLDPKHEIDAGDRLPRNIQIYDEDGEKIVLMTNDEGDDDEDSDDEDREFTVIVDDEEVDDDDMEEGQNGYEDSSRSDDDNIELVSSSRTPKGRIEAESIEDILAQFESESQGNAVSCPNCRKCFVSSHFLSLHISNTSTLCDLCNTQCCSAVNLRNHQNIECGLSKRKRNIDLIAQETALLGRKPIEPEKYYNLPIESSDDEDTEFIPARRLVRSVNDQKYECSICGQYVKILDSHMKFIHGLESGARGSKYKCPDCGVLVTDHLKHKALRHDPGSKAVIISDMEPEVVRCKNPGCDMFFNNSDEVAEHNKREHSDEVKLACGMGGCNAIFDNRGSLRKHRNDNHPELEEFKPVELEPDDPDRELDLTVACPVCERKFKHKNTCTVHIKVHHLGWCKRKLFECPDCFKPFENKKLMDLHREAIHLGIRTVCPLCDKPVTRLDLHVRMVHTELPEWPCPDCGKKFKRKFDLNRHRVTVHLGVRNFPCDLCGKRFADMKDMTRHKNAVHYGMKIKWNSRRHKEERMRKRAGGGGVTGGMEVGHDGKYNSNSGRTVGAVMHKRRRGGLPMEFIEAVDSNGTQIHIEESGEMVDGSVILDPMDPLLHSQLAAVQGGGGGAGEPRVLIEADPHSSGGLRFVVIQDGNNLVGDDGDEEENDVDEDDEHQLIVEQEA